MLSTVPHGAWTEWRVYPSGMDNLLHDVQSKASAIAFFVSTKKHIKYPGQKDRIDSDTIVLKKNGLPSSEMMTETEIVCFALPTSRT